MFTNLLDPYILSGAAGMLFSALLVYYIGRKKPHVRGNLTMGYISAIFGMFVGAHLLFFIVGLPDFHEKYGKNIYDIQSCITAILNASSGMVFYGGLLGAMAGVILYCKAAHLNVRSLLNIACTCYPLLHAFGRIGCSIGGCCYGIEYHGLFAIQYAQSHIKPGISDHIADFSRFPVQPLEALCEFILCAVILIIYMRTENKYSLAAFYLFTYGIIRFADEYLRGDVVRGLWGPFSTSQWIALICIVSVVIWFFVTRKRRKTREYQTA